MNVTERRQQSIRFLLCIVAVIVVNLGCAIFLFVNQKIWVPLLIPVIWGAIVGYRVACNLYKRGY